MQGLTKSQRCSQRPSYWLKERCATSRHGIGSWRALAEAATFPATPAMGPGQAHEPPRFLGSHVGPEKKKGEAIRELMERALDGLGPSLPSGGKRGRWAGSQLSRPAPALQGLLPTAGEEKTKTKKEIYSLKFFKVQKKMTILSTDGQIFLGR